MLNFRSLIRLFTRDLLPISMLLFFFITLAELFSFHQSAFTLIVQLHKHMFRIIFISEWRHINSNELLKPDETKRF